jgi:hypothetical protein
LLGEFSRRTTGRLRAALPLRLALRAIEPILADNVAKEARKDALVVGCAAQALAAGAPPGGAALERLLADAREIDRQFLSRAAALPLRLEVPYARIEPLRRRRIELGLELAYRILAAWRSRRRLRDEFSAADLEGRLRAMLSLYCDETAELGRGVSAGGPLSALRERAAARLREVMAEAAAQLSAEAARAVHRPRFAAQKKA